MSAVAADTVDRYQPRPRRRGNEGPTRQQSEVVDLSELEETRPETTRAARPYQSNSPAYSGSYGTQTAQAQAVQRPGTTAPNFKLYFDFLLTRRPGVSPITFDNYHTIFMVDFVPRPDLSFGFEVSPTPRYYELTYEPTSQFQLRVGRIWIPFDTSDFHNIYGGWINTSQLMHPGGTPFLPDVWTDLGVAMRFRPIDRRAMAMEAHAYVVNGFQGGQVDPAGKSNDYPDFSTRNTFVDNNGDKAVGGRVAFKTLGFWGLGISGYYGRWTGDTVGGSVAGTVGGVPAVPQKPARLLAVGFDTQFYLGTSSILKAGYIGMIVDLPPPADKGFQRGGLYGELSHRFLQKWRILFRGGMSQNDNRVIDVTDRTIVGAGLYHHFNSMVFLGVEHYRDINRVSSKSVYSFSALRLSVVL